MVLPGTGCSLGMGRLYAMRWSSVTLSATLDKVVSRSLPDGSQCSRFVYSNAADSSVEC